MIKIFLVEDEIAIRESIEKIMPWSEYGFELVGEAGDGETALAKIKKSRPDVLVTDIKMPFMDGLTLSRIVKKELPNIKIVIISGYDDFEYARQAINIGVEEYLLKPVTRAAFIEALKNIKLKFENELSQRQYFEKFQREIQNYEQHSRCSFFEKLISGNFSIEDIYESAEKLQLDVVAECYNVIMFTVYSPDNDTGGIDSYSQIAADIQNSIDEFFANNEKYILFRNYMFSYAVIVKSKKGECRDAVKCCILELENIFGGYKSSLEWFIAAGKEVERLSAIKDSYSAASKAFSYRYMSRRKVVWYYGEDCSKNGQYYRSSENEKSEKLRFEDFDVSVVNTDNLKNFLTNGLMSEVDSFVDNYFNSIKKSAMKSTIFRQYIILNIRFAISSFVQKLNVSGDELDDDDVDSIVTQKYTNIDEITYYCKNIIKKAIALRDEKAGNQYNSVLHSAISFIDEHYTEDTLSLMKVSHAANVSPNHFSALFSQKMGCTFTEYLTELRMKKAKELLRCTDMRSSEIALNIGYKDSHYFSFLFKKTQGLTPSDYRNQRIEG